MASNSGNGFLSLKQYLKEMSSVRHALNTGRPLLFCLQEQDRLPTQEQKKSVSPSSSSSYNDASLPRLGTASLAVEVQRIKFRKQEHFFEKLGWIYKILCGLTNMKSRDLKTLVPLPSAFVNILMKDTEKTNILLKNSLRCLITNVHEENQHIYPDPWDAFVSQEHEFKSSSVKCGGKPVQFDLRRKQDLKELESEIGDLPPWLNLLFDETCTYETNTQKSDNGHNMLERVKTDFLDVQRSMNEQMETDIFEKKMHRKARMTTLLNALMTPKKDTTLPMLLSSLKNEVKEPKSSEVFWYEILKRDAQELADHSDTECWTILEKIGQVNNFLNKKCPYAKEKFCLLVLSLPTNVVLRPAVQDALMFLTKNVLQLLPRQLKHWFQYLKLPFYEAY